MSVEWFININQSLDLNPSNLFIGKEIINYNEHPLDNSTYVSLCKKK